MPSGASRALTAAEKARVSPGLAAALHGAGASPLIVNRAHPGARIAALWYGSAPILARPGRIFWPGALDDYGEAPDEVFATLQHELQHLLDYATGALTGVRYLLGPRHWRYRYELGPQSRWDDFGAEQRACIAEHLWLLEQGRGDLVGRATGKPPNELERYRRVVPWAAGPHPPVP